MERRFEIRLEELMNECAEHRVEECIQRAKSETGLADYEVRNWLGWHHHQTMGLMATWFLVQEARRGKKYTPAITLQQVRQALARLLSFTGGCYTPSYNRRETRRRLRRTAKARLYHWRECNRLAPLHIHQRR